MIKDLGRIVGLSAYEEAVKNGFNGTFAEWIETLKVKVTDLDESMSGNTNTITLTFNDGSTYSFTVENGKEITSITKTASTATDSTLLVAYNDGTTETVTIPNGTGISSVEKIGTSGLVDTYQINYSDKPSTTFTVTNARSITSIAKSGSDGIVDTYTITYNDNTTSTFTVVNSIDTVPHDYSSEFVTPKVFLDNGEVGTTMQRNNGQFSYTTSTSYGCIEIPVKGGQIFRITATGSNSRATFLLIGSDYKIKAKSNAALTNYRLMVEEDGYLLVNTSHPATSSVKRVTIFNEVETAIDSIPSTQTLVNRVIEALPLAEGGSF